MGLSSAEGYAPAISLKTSIFVSSAKYLKKLFKSDLLIPPIGLRSAALQSYFVK